jgi:ATP-binding cassette, subfamily C, bacterial LapB
MSLLATEIKDVAMPHKKNINSFTLIVSTIAANILSLALPIATLQVYDRVLPNQAESTMYVLLMGVALIIVLEILLRLTKSYLIAYNGAAFLHSVSCEVIRHLLATDAKVDSAKHTGTFLNKIQAIKALKDFNNGYSLCTTVEFVFVPLYLALIAFVSGILVVIPISILVLFAIFVASNGRRLASALENRGKADDTRYNYLLGTLNSAHSIKAFALERILLRRYEDLQSWSCLANHRVASVVTLTFNIGAVFANVLTASVIGVGSLFVVNGNLSMGSLIAVTLLSGRVMQPIQRGLALWARHQEYKDSKAKVEELFALPVAETNVSATDPDRLGDVKVRGITFGYDANVPMFKDISLDVRHGETVIIDGPIGSGKSTLLKLITGALQPKSGQVFIDGVCSSQYAQGMLMNHVGYLSPDAVIFRGTIRDNITRFGLVPVAQALSVAELLGLTEEVAKLPAGYDTHLDASGTDSIPPGVKQRIALARALASKPRVIVFDAADRALDVQGYQKLFTLLGRLKNKAAIVLVSDDKNIADLADRRLWLEGGRLNEVSEDTFPKRAMAGEIRL